MGMPQYMDMQMYRNNAVSVEVNFSEQLNSSAVEISGQTGQHNQHYNISLFLSCLYITFLFPVGFFGNILILVVNLSHRSPMKAPDLYFVNLAAADLVLVADSLIEVFNLSSHYYDMAALCTFMTLFLQVNMYSSIFFLTWMSFDRFVVLSGSVHLGRSMPRARLSCCLVWVSSALLTLLPFAMVQAQHAGELNFCFANVSQIQWLGVTLGFLVPFCVLGLCYWRIACLLARAQREHSELRNQPRRQKALRMLSAAVMVFFICWLPENVFISVHLLRGEADGDTLWHDYPLTAHIVSLAAFSNSCLNPLVYSFLGETFQDKLRLFAKKRSWSKLHSSYFGNSPNLPVSIPSSHPKSCKSSCQSTQCLQYSNRLHRDNTTSSNSNVPQVFHHPYVP